MYNINIYTMYMQFFDEPLAKIIRNPNLEGQFLAHGGGFPSTPVPCLVATATPFGLCPFHPFTAPQPTLHYLQ
jgi:hypothetical protein